MTRLDRVIEDIKAVDASNSSWLFENGKLKDDVICGDVIPFLEELKEYEVECSDDAIDGIIENAENHWNTYNFNASISHNIDVAEYYYLDECVYMAIMVHRYGDVRGNYTNRFVVKFDDICDFYELESRMQYKTIMDGKYTCDIDIFSECYNVWDNDNQTDIGEFYEIEVKDLLESIEERTK